MQLREPKKINISPCFYLKCIAPLFLFVLSILIVACSGSDTTATLNGTNVTVTIHIGSGSNGSPTPHLPDYWCGAWATQTSPSLGTAAVGVYAKFTHNVNGNPEGVPGATAEATVLWFDGNTSTEQATTSSDGLAVFSISTVNRAVDVGKITLVTVTFSGGGAPSCTVDADRSAFFTLVGAASTSVASPVSTATGTPTGTPTAAATGIPTPIRTPILPTPTCTKKRPNC